MIQVTYFSLFYVYKIFTPLLFYSFICVIIIFIELNYWFYKEILL